MEINFKGSLKPTGSPIKISSTGDAIITIVASSSEIAEVIKLTMAQDKELSISIDVSDE